MLLAKFPVRLTKINQNIAKLLPVSCLHLQLQFHFHSEYFMYQTCLKIGLYVTVILYSLCCSQ